MLSPKGCRPRHRRRRLVEVLRRPDAALSRQGQSAAVCRASSSASPPSPPTCRARRRSPGATAIPASAIRNGRMCRRCAACAPSVPANRSDGYLGSDISGDDGFFFDGKPEDFDVEALSASATRCASSIPTRLRAPLTIEPAPGGGWMSLTNLNPPTVGYLNAGLDRPVLGADRRRRSPSARCGSSKAVPKDKYYLYGKLELWIDAETWDGFVEPQVQLGRRDGAQLPGHGQRQPRRRTRERSRVGPGGEQIWCVRGELQDEPRHARRHAPLSQCPVSTDACTSTRITSSRSR